MPWHHKAREFCKRFGTPAKFVAKLVLATVAPGSTEVIALIEKALDCAHETAKDCLDASPADLLRVEQTLDMLLGEMQPLLAKLARLEALPDLARERLELALATDDVCRRSARAIEQCVGAFDRLRQQQEQMLIGQEEMRPILRRMVGVCDYIDELRSAGCAPEQFARLLERFSDAHEAFAGHRYADADRLLRTAAIEQPHSASVAIALAATQTAEQEFLHAEEMLARAVRLRPGDADLVELHRRLTIVSRRGNTPRDSLPGSAAPLRAGDVLDGWPLEQLLGRGGWGQVWKTSRAGQRAALKAMHPELARDPSFVDRFKREIKALMRLDHHDNLAEIDTFGFDRGSWYFVMRYVEGVALDNHLGRRGALSLDQVKRLFAGVAEGLALAHARRIVHRDIKPANVLLRADGSGVLVDFGLAGLADSTNKAGKTGCTPLFAAPEQLRSGQADARSDVFALAATLYYSLAYDDPAHREPHCYSPTLVPQPIRALLTRSLANDPAERPADASAFLAALREDAATGRAVGVPDGWAAAGGLLIRLRPRFDQAAYPPNKDPNAHVLLELDVRKNPGVGPANAGADIVLLLDVSLSMNRPERYPWLRKAVSAFLKQMARDDRLSIVLFSASSDVLMQPHRGAVVCADAAIDKILAGMDQSGSRFCGKQTLLAPALRGTLNLLQRPNAADQATQRVYVLTDGELHDAAESAKVLAEFRARRVEVRAYGFGTDFNPTALKQMLAGQVGGSVKPICDETDIVDTFAHIAAVNRRLVASDAQLHLQFHPQIGCGGGWTFRPQERYLGQIEKRQLQYALGGLEKDRTYTLLFEVQLPPERGPRTQIADAELTWTEAGTQLRHRRAIEAVRLPPTPNTVPDDDAVAVRRAVAILDALRRPSDRDAELGALRARLELAGLEDRDPELIKALQMKIDHLEGTLQESNWDMDLDEAELYVDSDEASQVCCCEETPEAGEGDAGDPSGDIFMSLDNDSDIGPVNTD